MSTLKYVYRDGVGAVQGPFDWGKHHPECVVSAEGKWICAESCDRQVRAVEALPAPENSGTINESAIDVPSTKGAGSG